MKKPVTNVSASILARLKNQSERSGRPVAEILQYYAMERFIYRLSKTKYATKFILKGSLLFYVWNIPLRRPTRDIDFRGYVTNDGELLLKIFNEVASVPAPEDGLIFNVHSISIEATQIDADYQGIRVKLVSLLDRTRIPVQIDIGFSDELSSKAEPIEYPSILFDIQTVRMKGYPKEAMVAEKFHAMIHHGDVNSRLKDYYDLWLILRTFEFDDTSLQKAIETTFKKRDTEIPNKRPLSLSADFARASQVRWTNFLSKMELDNAQADDFQSVLKMIWEFLGPPVQSALNQTQSTRKWKPQKGWQ